MVGLPLGLQFGIGTGALPLPSRKASTCASLAFVLIRTHFSQQLDHFAVFCMEFLFGSVSGVTSLFLQDPVLAFSGVPAKPGASLFSDLSHASSAVPECNQTSVLQGLYIFRASSSVYVI